MSEWETIKNKQNVHHTPMVSADKDGKSIRLNKQAAKILVEKCDVVLGRISIEIKLNKSKRKIRICPVKHGSSIDSHNVLVKSSSGYMPSISAKPVGPYLTHRNGRGMDAEWMDDSPPGLEFSYE